MSVDCPLAKQGSGQQCGMSQAIKSHMLSFFSSLDPEYRCLALYYNLRRQNTLWFSGSEPDIICEILTYFFS